MDGAGGSRLGPAPPLAGGAGPAPGARRPAPLLLPLDPLFPSQPHPRTLCPAAIITRFEGELSRLNPTRPQLTYEVQDLASYIERMPDLSALVFEDSIQAYVPCGKEWIKGKAVQALQRTAQRRR